MTDGPFSLMNELAKVKGKEKPPIHLWHPEHVKAIDMQIKVNGDWFYEGSVIKRQRLVHLFASVLRREADEYFLVTPVEKCLIEVEDVPFQVILLSVSGEGRKQILSFTTNMADEIEADTDHALRFESVTETPAPYLHVRDGLDARLNRNVYYQLAELLVEEDVTGNPWLGVWSHEVFFPVISSTGLD